MRKSIAALIAILILVSCEKPADCFKSTGAMTVKEYNVPDFSKVIVGKGIALVIRQGVAYKVEVHSGENLINDIEVSVDGGLLRIEDNTSCNWTRDYGQTTVYVTTPVLTDIYSKTELPVTSEQVLTFPELHLHAMDSNDNYSGTGTGDFSLNVDNAKTTIETNTVARFFIGGHTQYSRIDVYAYGPVVDTRNLEAENLYVYHRGTNDVYVHPVQSLSADLFSLGNLISVSHPPVVDVRQYYDGRLIYY